MHPFLVVAALAAGIADSPAVATTTAAPRAAKPKAVALVTAIPPAANALSGKVTDTAGTPLAEVRVTLLEANRFALTASDGRYLIPDIPGGTYGVSFAAVGYAPQVRRITIGSEDAVLDVAMRPSLVELPPLQVTATPLATTSLTSPQPTSILAEGDLARAQAPSLGETIDGLAGVRNLSTGQGIGKPVIRGLTSNRVVILADGQRLENQQWGDEHGPNVETADAERIEVIRGPGSVLYGSDAIGGVVNVVPRELPDAIGRPGFVGGEFTGSFATNGDAPDGTAMIEGARGAIGFRGSVTGRSSGDLTTPAGKLLNSGNRAVGGTGAAGVRGGWGSLGASYAYRDERVEIHEDPSEGNGASPFQRIGAHRGQLTVNIPAGVSRLEIDAGYQRNRRREFEAAGSSDVALGLLSETYSGDAHFHHVPVGRFGGIVGLSYRRDDFSKFGQETLIPNSSADNIGAYVFEQTEAGRWSFSVGARYDYRNLDVESDDALSVAAQTRSYNSVTGHVGALFRVSEPVALVLNVGRGFRAPSTFDLFSNGVHEGTARFERGNPALRNETSFNGDLAVRVQTEAVSAEVGGFVNLIDDYIYPNPSGEIDDESGFQIFDIAQGNARLAGFEASAEYHATAWLHFRGTADYTHGQNTTVDQPLAFVPPFRVTGSVRVEGERRAWLRDTYVTFGGESNARQTRTDPEDFAPDGYSAFNAGAGFSIPTAGRDIGFDVTVRNLFDRRYRGFLSRYKTYADDPGRNVILRVSTRF